MQRETNIADQTIETITTGNGMSESNNEADTCIETLNHLHRSRRPTKDTDGLLESKQTVNTRDNNYATQTRKLSTQMINIITTAAPCKKTLHTASSNATRPSNYETHKKNMHKNKTIMLRLEVTKPNNCANQTTPFKTVLHRSLG